MQLRILFAGGNVGIGIEEEWSGIEGVGAAMNVGRAVKIVGAGGGAHVNVRAAGGALLGVVHGGVDAKFFYRFGRRRGQSLTNCEIGRGGGLDDCSAAAGGAAGPGVFFKASGGDFAGGFAIEEGGWGKAVEEKTC